MNSVMKDYELVLPDDKAIEDSVAQYDGAVNPVYQLFQALADLKLVEVEGERMIWTNNTDCVACGNGAPGKTNEYANNPNSPGHCVAMDTCGATVNDTINMAAQSLADQGSPDTEFASRLQSKLAMSSSGDLINTRFAQGFEGMEGLMAALEKQADGRIMDVKPDGTFDTKNLPSAYILWYKVAVYCSYTDDNKSSDLLRDCSDQKSLKTAIKALFTDITGQWNMAVYPDVIEELLMDYVDPSVFDEQAPPYKGNCPGYTVFNVHITTVQEFTYEALQARFLKLDDSKDVILAALKSSQTNNGIQLCDMASWLMELRTLGHFDRMGTYTPSMEQLGPGVSLAKTGLITPAATLVPGDSVKVSVFNFPQGSTISLYLMGKSTDPLDNPEPLFKLKNFVDQGATTVDWVVPNGIEYGEYYLKASSLGLTTFSQLVEIVQSKAQARTRRTRMFL